MCHRDGAFDFQISKNPSFKIYEKHKSVFYSINYLLWKIKITGI